MKQVNEDTSNGSDGMVLSADSKSTTTFGRLVEACKRKELNTIAKLLSQRPDLVNRCDHLNRSLLHYAVITVASSSSSSASSLSASSLSESDDSNGDEDDVDNNERVGTKRRPSAKSVESAEQVNERQSRRLKLLERTKECIRVLSDKCDPSLWSQLDSDGLSILHLAVISSDESLVRYLIYEHTYSTKWPLVQVCDRERHSPLHWAVITNNLNCVKLLISHSGVSLAHQADINGATPVHYATQTSEYPKYRRQLKQMLIRGGAEAAAAAAATDKGKGSCVAQVAPVDVGSRPGSCHNNKQQTTDTETQCSNVTSSSSTRAEDRRRREQNLEILAYLVRLPDINLECRDKDHRTPLLWAASSGNRAAIELLVTYGADLNCVDGNRLSALHCAASHGYSDCLESLLAIASKRPAAAAAAAGGSNGGCSGNDVVLVVDRPDNLECTPLFYGVLSGNIDCVEILLDKGAKIDWQDAKGRSAAHFAALKGQLNALKLLDARGGNLWLANKQGDLPLHYAIKSGRIQVVRWLLEHSPYERAVNAINNFGRAPIHLAVMRDNVHMADYLIKNGANLAQLVKVREKASSSSLSSSSSRAKAHAQTDIEDHKSIVLVNQSTAHRAGKSGGSVYRYETALDMARRLSHCDCLKVLTQNQAPTAGQVLELRKQSLEEANRVVAKRSLFDMQSADGTSPIGFETSASSVSSGPSPLQPLAAVVRGRATEGAAEPKADGAFAQQVCGEPSKLGRPAPAVAEPIPKSDESSVGGSSALSHSSLTSVRRAAQEPPSEHVGAVDNGDKRDQSAADSGQARRTGKPYKGGISYHNDHINASIKCKLYGGSHAAEQAQEPLVGCAGRRHSSFPQMRPRRAPHQQRIGEAIGNATSIGNGSGAERHAQMMERTRSGSCGAVSLSGQEIVTNVNVYTSPCNHCFEAGSGSGQWASQQVPMHVASCRHKSAAQRRPAQRRRQDDSDETDDATSDATSDATTVIDHAAPVDQPAGCVEQAGPPPTSDGGGALPVIMSDHGRSVSGASYDTSTPTDESRRVSPAFEEPRFDRARQAGATGRRKLAPSSTDRYREHARSPVRDYIRAPRCCRAHGDGDGGATNRASYRSVSQGRPARDEPPEVSLVRPRVDSHWANGAADCGHQSPRSVSRNTQTRSTTTTTTTRCKSRGAANEDEAHDIASSIERSIWKYKQESKLFDELKNLKRSQIRSGRANEALLVKRLVERFQHEDGSYDTLLGLDIYNGPYTYKSYEVYLYDQLRKLSQSNSSKLAELSRLAEQQQGEQTQPELARTDNDKLESKERAGEKAQAVERDYLEEDLRAELELRRLIDADSGTVMDTPEAADERQEPPPPPSVVTAPAAPDEPSVEGACASASEAGEEAEDECATASKRVVRVPSFQHSSSGGDASSAASSRRSSVEVEREKLHSLPLRVAADSRQLATDGDETGSGGGGDTSAQRVGRRESSSGASQALVDEAGSLASSILVDALGNISRRGSPAHEQPAAQAGESPADEPQARAEAEREPPQPPLEGCERGEGEEDGDEAGGEAAQVGRRGAPPNRRRSVVNIGNKIEVIYHNVGIEIEPVAERGFRASLEGSDADEAEALAATSRKRPQVSSLHNVAEESSSPELESVDASEQASEPLGLAKRQSEDLTMSCENTSCTTDMTTTTTTTTTTAAATTTSTAAASVATTTCDSDTRPTEDEATEGEQAERVDTIDDDDDDDEEEASQALESAQQVDTDKKSAFLAKLPPAQRRRASSPSVVDLGAAGRGSSDRAVESRDDELRFARFAASRRETIAPSIAPLKLNGASLHDNWARREASSDASAARDVNGEVNGGSGRGEDADENGKQQRVFNGYDLDKTHRQRQLARQASSSERKQPEQLAHEPAARKSPQSPRLRRKLERSRLPSRELKIEVPADEIHNRWLDVKETERRRLRGRSHPNLAAAELGSRQLPDDADADDDVGADQDECSNYTLLYEINKRLKGVSRAATKGDASSSTTSGAHATASSIGAGAKTASATGRRRLDASALCRSRVVRIVDSRTLRRTASLPESLIYSNDLLKRFNILKL